MPKTKKYVSSPQREWLKKDLKNDLIEIIKYGKLVDEKIIDFEKWKSLMIFIQFKEIEIHFCWKILNAEFLLKEFFNGKFK